MAALRQVSDDGKNPRQALETAKQILPEIENEEKFSEARGDLSTISPDIADGFAMQAPISAIQAIAARDDVDYLVEDGYLQLPKDELTPSSAGPNDPSSNWNIYQVNAPQTWAIGYDGTGRVVANQDTGVDGAHQALSTRWRGIQPGHSPADSWLDPFGVSPNFLQTSPLLLVL